MKKLKWILPNKSDEELCSVMFHGVNGEDYQQEDSPSWMNLDEASQVFHYVNELFSLGLESSDIGIISPYIKQVRHLRSIFNEAEFKVPKIGTTEEFQGQEFNVVIISTVRTDNRQLASDRKHALGFVSNPKRLNVALTRAKVLTIVIGHPYLLSTDKNWRQYINYCITRGSYCGCDFTLV